MTVVVILAILVAIALPSLATQGDMNASAASRVVLADLLYAQGQAIATGQQQYVSFTLASNAPGGTSGSYSLSCPFGTVLTNPVSKQPYTKSFGSGVASALDDVELANMNLDNASNTVLVFDSRGEPLACPANGTPVLLANTGTIVLQSGAAKVTLSIEPDTGNITVTSDN
jgi:Tfp pilus assembly protein FimT